MSLSLHTSSQPLDLETLIQDKEIFEAFLLVLFYDNLLIDNPLIQERLFLFVENYLSIAQSLNTANENDQKKILSSIHIQEKKLDQFFLGYWDAGLYGHPFFRKGEIERFFSEIIHNSEISSAGLCGEGLVYFLREKFIREKENISVCEWSIVIRHMYNSPMFVAEIMKKFQPLSDIKKEVFMKIMEEKYPSFSWT